MAEFDPSTTEHETPETISAELASAGFTDAHEIGRGGFGVVYRCRQVALDRTVAIKVLTSVLDRDNLERFLREQRAMGRLSNHPNIVTILQVGTTGSGRPYLVMPYYPRDSLEVLIRRHGPLDWSDALRVGIKVADALEAAHRAGIVHRDIKPGNILLDDYSEPLLTDFGIARISGAFETGAGMIAGSPAYTAPEVLEGLPPTAASDIYGLGATLFCALTGHAAFERRSGEKLVAQFLRITTAPTPKVTHQGIPGEVTEAIEHAMASRPAERPPSAAHFADALRSSQRRFGLAVDTPRILTATRLPIDGELDHDSTASATGVQLPTGRSLPTAPATRFRAPALPRMLVDRDRLISALRAGKDRRLVTIHAPAGYGKSTLAAHWARTLTDEGTAVAWLTIDDDDNSAVVFLTHLIEAIRHVRAALARDLGQILEEHGGRAERYVLTSLINDIHDSGDPLALVLDDWHRITATAPIEALTFLLDNGCHHLQFIITSRSQAGLPSSRMRVLDELVEIDFAALRFTTDESHTLLVDGAHLPLRKDDIARLTEVTDGWAAALQLASLSLRGSTDPESMITTLPGHDRTIGHYLADNVLDDLDAGLLDFLLATSVTDKINGSLASRLANTSRGQAMLEQVEESDLFLRRTDVDGHWFRYHHLFAKYLRQRLDRDQPERVQHLHQTASRWFADHGMLGEAVDHALAADDPHNAMELIERHGMVLVTHTQFTTLLSLVTKLPPEMVESSARLQLTIAWADIRLDRHHAADRALARAQAALSATPTHLVSELSVESDIARALLRLRSDHLDGIEEFISEPLSHPDDHPASLVSVALSIASFAALHRFDFDQVRRLQDQSLPYFQRDHTPYLEMHGLCYLGIAADEQLQIAAAEDYFRDALRVGRQAGGRESIAARLAGSLLGQLFYERDQIDDAKSLIDEGYQLGSEVGGVDFKQARYAISARLKALHGDRDEAAQRLDEGIRVAVALSLDRLYAKLENERIRLDLPPTVNSRPPVRYSDRRPLTTGLEEATAQLEEDTAIRLLVAEGEPNALVFACDWAQEWVDRLRGSRRQRALRHPD
ncbi:MAG: protein kinase, partial [Rhodococcus sp. (in: high G+C Gram-positive bacteria)]